MSVDSNQYTVTRNEQTTIYAVYYSRRIVKGNLKLQLQVDLFEVFLLQEMAIEIITMRIWKRKKTMLPRLLWKDIIDRDNLMYSRLGTLFKISKATSIMNTSKLFRNFKKLRTYSWKQKGEFPQNLFADKSWDFS